MSLRVAPEPWCRPGCNGFCLRRSASLSCWCQVSHPGSNPRAHTVANGRVLPAESLVRSLMAGVSTRCFKTFLCDPFQISESETRRFLADDLLISCDEDEYPRLVKTALVMISLEACGRTRALHMLDLCQPRGTPDRQADATE
eukprot:3117677-Prymnesium_polylepis.1